MQNLNQTHRAAGLKTPRQLVTQSTHKYSLDVFSKRQALIVATSATTKRRGGGGGDEDVEIFSISKGWNVEALANSPEMLEEIEEWGVESYVEDDDDDIDDDSEDFAFEDDATTDIFEASSSTTSIPLSKEPKTAGAPSSSKTKQPSKQESGSAERDFLASVPRHMIRRLNKLQVEADAENERLTPRVQKKEAARRKTHKHLKIISGTAAGRRILSPQGDQTRPMMEMVRGAVFSMITSLHGTTEGLPEGSRWLDLFAGTGAVGIEALSRGCREAHFVELSPWVVSNCLMKNLATCGVDDSAVVHTTKAEDFLKRANDLARFAGGAFDFISVCPPYELVSYPELYELLEDSPLLHKDTIVIVEYPKKLAHQVLDTLGPLYKLKDRKYGRTFIAIYGPDYEGLYSTDDDGVDNE